MFMCSCGRRSINCNWSGSSSPPIWANFSMICATSLTGAMKSWSSRRNSRRLWIHCVRGRIYPATAALRKSIRWERRKSFIAGAKLLECIRMQCACWKRKILAPSACRSAERCGCCNLIQDCWPMSASARFILVDEFQDCNSSNIILTELLAGDEQNIFAVGDPDQAIYRFRGASSAAFEEFQKRFPRTKAVTLEENQRSRGSILRVGFAAIKENPEVSSFHAPADFRRVPLQSARDMNDQQSGRFVFDEPVEVAISASDAQEGADIAGEILEIQRNRRGREQYSMAVLYRSHANREKLMQELAAREIPFLVKAMDVLDTAVVRDLLAVARAVANDGDAESLFRMCAFPQFAMDAHELREKLSGAANKSTFRSILGTMDPGSRVLAAVESARSFIAGQNIGLTGIFNYLVRA